MSLRSSPIMLIAIASTVSFTASASAQLYYIPFRVPTHPVVSPAWFGESFGVDGNQLYIASLGNSPGLPNEPGGVYRFDKDTLTYQQTYNPIGDPQESTFGYSMEYYDGVLLVGAINDQSTGTFDIGAAHLINPTTGALIHTFDESPNATLFSEFGIDVSINDVAIAIGAIGYDPSRSGQVFVYNAATNSLVITLERDPGTIDTNYGYKVKHNDDYLIVSALGSRNAGIQGAVYVYDFVTGVRLHRFTSPVSDVDGTGQFGYDIELLGDRLFVGAGLAAPVGVLGRVTVYDLPTGNIITTLSGNTTNDSDGFGSAISAENSTLVVGAQYDNSFDGDNTGAVYVFDADTYEMIDKVYPPLPTSDQVLFGRKVKIQDGTILTSSLAEDQFGERIGTAYILRQFCRQDINLDGSIDFFDVSAFIKFGVDFNEDGTFDFFDISSFLTAFQQPCP